MYMDAQNRPSLNQSLAGTGTIKSTDRIDLLTSIDNPGRGGMLRAVAVMSATLAGATSVQAQLVSTENSDGTSPRVIASGDVIPVASAAAGTKLLDTPLPDTDDRYLGFQYVIVGTATAGSVTAGIVGGTDRPVMTIPMNTGR